MKVLVNTAISIREHTWFINKTIVGTIAGIGGLLDLSPLLIIIGIFIYGSDIGSGV